MWSFGKASRPALAPAWRAPGPDTYSLPEREGLGSLVTTLKNRRGLEKLRSRDVAESVPGPGHYGGITSIGRPRPTPRVTSGGAP